MYILVFHSNSNTDFYCFYINLLVITNLNLYPLKKKSYEFLDGWIDVLLPLKLKLLFGSSQIILKNMTIMFECCCHFLENCIKLKNAECDHD